MCALVGSDQTAGRQIKDTRNPPSAASIWSGNLKQELHNWYWHEMSPSSKGCQLAGWKFGAMLRVLGLSEKEKNKGGDNQCFRVEHWDAGKEDDEGEQVPAINQWYNVGETDYRVRERETKDYGVCDADRMTGYESTVRVYRKHQGRGHLLHLARFPPLLRQPRMVRQQERP
jgi:hypothetical protein